MYAVTIDTGTTNTRVYVWRDDEIIAEGFQPVGVRDTAIIGSKEKLTLAVKAAIDEALEKAKITERSQVTFLASGMITSNVGLCEIPHLLAPAGKKELAQSMVKMELPEVLDQPIWFVPGVKNNVPEITLDTCEEMDVIRGEEVETVGVTEKLQLKGPAIIILPGSHSKLIGIDEQNRITGCVSTISGELLDVITKQTILANALENSFATEVDEQVLLKGAQYAKKVGLGRTCFTLRILDMFSGMTINQKANFLLGAVLATDILAVKNSRALQVDHDTHIVVCGKKTLKLALAALVKNDEYFTGPLTVMGDEHQAISGYGVIAIAREKGIL
ncbi:MAG TPA: 2-dehydro-3-deoxygalactonokinase [Candidatus Bathyarchaeia archaeon]|nr:2-dehydro-3-deoxygalactonokinase [Candidatus Bathyarchaeia archaeon]